MKTSDLLTPAGLFTALKSHHQNLHKNHGFPPLNGLKPLHRLAELFELGSAESLENALKDDLRTLKSTLPQTSTIPLNNVNTNENLHYQAFIGVYIEKDKGNTLVRVQQKEALDGFFEVAVNERYLGILPKVERISRDEVKIHIDDIYVSLGLNKKGTLAATLFEKEAVRDYTFIDIPPVVNVQARASINTHILTLKQEGRIYTSAHLSYPDALAALVDTVIEDFEQHDELTDAKELEIRSMDEQGLDTLYRHIHDDALVQINTSTLHL